MTIDNLTVKDSSVHGMGLFSNVDHKEGQLITIINGELINGDECVRREDEGNVYIFYKDDDEYIDAANHSQLRYLNCLNVRIENFSQPNISLFQ